MVALLELLLQLKTGKYFFFASDALAQMGIKF
jgi:hypothetical protein